MLMITVERQTNWDCWSIGQEVAKRLEAFGCSISDQTHHLINKEVLLALGKEGVIINVGRGAIIDEKEMVQCLVQGDIGGAGLDVFENEPNVPKELFAFDNVVLSLHRDAFTHETLTSMREIAVGNLEAFFSNKLLLSQVMDD
uniref:D-isomer specific 2-hydroxyacid dehydrogenase NAD-binding domain-containing protein n=1 Tax=Quercus lobata TaxID=97700 RepID=A0A7N2MDT8_QUELO